jgi:MFS family permease
MRESLPLCLGVFCVMALSNAIVPVLPSYAAGTALQGAVYSAYFLGAFLLVLPAGLLSDRYGQTILIRTGLLLTLASGVLLILYQDPFAAIPVRFLEGVGAGLFVASALSWVNSKPDHLRLSGFFMATLNIGLVAGLVISGLAIAYFHLDTAGVIIFSGISAIALVSHLLIYRESPEPEGIRMKGAADGKLLMARLKAAFRNYFWLWFSSLVLIGATGAVTALYPQFSGQPADTIGLELAVMNGATVVAVLLVSRVSLAPIPILRISALAMAGAVLLTLFSPIGFPVIGAVAGVVMISQLAFLAKAGSHQGVFMGLFNAAGYAGMSVMPFLAGIVAEATTFTAAFGLTALAAVVVAFTIGRCACAPGTGSSGAEDPDY